MKHKKLFIGTAIGCAVLLAGAALYVGCAPKLAKSRESSKQTAARERNKEADFKTLGNTEDVDVDGLAGADLLGSEGHTPLQDSVQVVPDGSTNSLIVGQTAGRKLGTVELIYGENSQGPQFPTRLDAVENNNA